MRHADRIPTLARMGDADRKVTRRRAGAAALLTAALLVLVAAPAARAQDGPPIEPVTPPIEPVTPPIEPVSPTVPADTITPAQPSAPFGSHAVVLVGGFNSSSPFSTPACATTDRGPTWGNATGPAASLDGAGLPVFVAPIANAGTPVAASCLGGRSTPDIPSDGSTVIDSNGELAGNQAALVAFLRFLNSSYGITTVQLVGHSDGGLWSRAAITQLRGGGSPVTVTSLTTIGTPHTGSFGADLMVALVNAGGACSKLTEEWEQLACELAEDAVEAAYQGLGEDVIEELTSSWLGSWNPTTSIGCPVTTLGGDFVGANVGVGTYYTPNDGIVGMASALNQGTWLPWTDAAPFTPVAAPNGGQLFDVVHSSSLSFLSPNTELNSADVGAAVVSSVQSPPAGPCAAASTSALKATSAGDAAADDAPVAQRGTRLDTVIPLHHRAAATKRGGSLGRSREGDAVVVFGDAALRCGSEKAPTTPLMGSRDVQVPAIACEKPWRSTGAALRLGRSDAHVRVTRRGRTVRWRIAGGKLRKVRAHVRADGKWRPVSGRTLRIPSASKDPALRVRGVDARSRVVRGHTRIG